MENGKSIDLGKVNHHQLDPQSDFDCLVICRTLFWCEPEYFWFWVRHHQHEHFIIHVSQPDLAEKISHLGVDFHRFVCCRGNRELYFFSKDVCQLLYVYGNGFSLDSTIHFVFFLFDAKSTRSSHSEISTVLAERRYSGIQCRNYDFIYSHPLSDTSIER